MQIKILDNTYKASDLKKLHVSEYESLLKGSVDLERELVAIGGEDHMDSANVLILKGSNFKNLWGFDLDYSEEGTQNSFEFHELVDKVHVIDSKQNLQMDENTTDRLISILERYIILNE